MPCYAFVNGTLAEVPSEYYEWVVELKQEKNVVRQYGRSGVEYKYAGSKNHCRAYLSAHGLTYDEMHTLLVLVAASLGSMTIIDALGKTYVGSPENLQSSRPHPDIPTHNHWVTVEMLDPVIT